MLASELDKLADYADGRAALTLDDVRAVGGYIPRVDRWGWFELDWRAALRGGAPPAPSPPGIG